MDEIVQGHSISLNFPAYRVFSSAIVGGSLPAAVGTAMGIMRRGAAEHVWCFMGDMTSETGMAFTCIRYAWQHALPVTFVVEDNGLSVCTPTASVWASGDLGSHLRDLPNVVRFSYTSKYPHAGAGVRVEF